MFEPGLLPLALVVSIAGITLQVWHRRGGPSWVFAVGGFLFILGRLMIAAVCALVFMGFVSRAEDMDGMGLLLIGVPAALILGIGAWSIFTVANYVYVDAFGRAREETTRASQPPRQS